MKIIEDEEKIKNNLYKSLKKGKVTLVCQSFRESNQSFIYDFMDYYVSKNKNNNIYYIHLGTSKDDLGINVDTYLKVTKFQELRNIILRGNLSLAVIDFNLLKIIRKKDGRSIESMLEDIKQLAIHRKIPVLVFSPLPVQIEVSDSHCLIC